MSGMMSTPIEPQFKVVGGVVVEVGDKVRNLRTGEVSTVLGITNDYMQAITEAGVWGKREMVKVEEDQTQ